MPCVRPCKGSELLGVGLQSPAQGEGLCVRVATLKERSGHGHACHPGGDQCRDLSRPDPTLSKDREASGRGGQDRGDPKRGPGRGL